MGTDQSFVCNNLGFLWSQDQVSVKETQCLSCLTGNIVDVMTPVEVICDSNLSILQMERSLKLDYAGNIYG